MLFFFLFAVSAIFGSGSAGFLDKGDLIFSVLFGGLEKVFCGVKVRFGGSGYQIKICTYLAGLWVHSVSAGAARLKPCAKIASPYLPKADRQGGTWGWSSENEYAPIIVGGDANNGGEQINYHIQISLNSNFIVLHMNNL